MNIFCLDLDVKLCAQYHNDKHVVKMILESCQLLSTAHRIIDGRLYIDTLSGRKVKRYELSDSVMDNVLYKATHINHPSAIWVRTCASNYRWLFLLYLELLDEYTYRYGKNHSCEKMMPYLALLPKNICTGFKFTQPTPAMPENIIVHGDSVASYRKYYKTHKQHLASWSGKVNSRPIPEWFKNDT